MRDLPELPQKYRDAFESARIKAELQYAKRAEDFPHHPQFADGPFHVPILIQKVFFDYCTQAREACRRGKLSLAQVSNAVDAAWPTICDHYVERERGECSDEEKSKLRVALWKTVTDDQQWKRHLSELGRLPNASRLTESSMRERLWTCPTCLKVPSS
jgi:hypothetical protein